ncbi:hypothetical protein [Paraburkholderia caffeinilytica]|uniref:hypothetical protein n=1 Tax=Paraburkholderia caffeinilytica TaxID=1761016 RepID=UPI003DA09166
MSDEAETATDSAGGECDPRWGLCVCPGCPLLGTLGRGGEWVCFCHFDADWGARDFVTAVIRRHFAVYRAVLDVRRGFVSERWPQAYREAQQRLIESGYADLLPDARDVSPYRPGHPIVQQWLARLERFLRDAVRAALRERMADAAANSSIAKRPPPSSRDCVARMRATLAPLAHRAPSAKWAFDLLDGIAARPANAPSPEAVRIALDAISSPAGRAYIANATDEQRGRWRAALGIIGGGAAGLIPSRVPGEDDEPVEVGVQHDPV